MALLEIKGGIKNYKSGKEIKTTFKNLNLKFNQSELIVIKNANTEEKSTILNILCGLEFLTEGNLYVDAIDIYEQKIRKIDKIRRAYFGIVLEDQDLISNLTVEENILLAKEINKNSFNIEFILEKLCLTSIKDEPIYFLSYIEIKRILLAMALIKKPKIILCNLERFSDDEKEHKKILKNILEIIKKEKILFIITTNNKEISSNASKILITKNATITHEKAKSKVEVKKQTETKKAAKKSITKKTTKRKKVVKA